MMDGLYGECESHLGSVVGAMVYGERRMASKESYKKDDVDGTRDEDKKS